jgi:hypothetical protein
VYQPELHLEPAVGQPMVNQLDLGWPLVVPKLKNFRLEMVDGSLFANCWNWQVGRLLKLLELE